MGSMIMAGGIDDSPEDYATDRTHAAGMNGMVAVCHDHSTCTRQMAGERAKKIGVAEVPVVALQLSWLLR